jgi:transglycosylase-like protein with SLT domain
MRCSRAAAIAFLLTQVVAASAVASGRKPSRPAAAAAKAETPLDRVAFAVDGAESSHGADQAMWRVDPNGPQGPMQVSAAAASDVGGGDRFDAGQNRAIGRAYLALLYRRYGDWPDAIAAYNWGIGNLDNWFKAGRPAYGAAPGVAAYLDRVVHDSGICSGRSARPPRRVAGSLGDCADLGAWASVRGDGRYPLGGGGGSSAFHLRLDNAMRLAAQHAGGR